MASEKLKEALRQAQDRWGKPRELPAVSLSPTNTFEALLDERIKALEKSIGEIKGRINGLLLTVVGAVVVQVVLNLLK